MTKNDTVLGSKEIICILANQITVKVFVGQARLFSSWAANAAWMVYLIGFLCQIGIFFLTAYLYKKDYDQDPVSLAGSEFGRAGEILVGVLFLLYVLFSFSALTRLYVEALKAAIFQYSPVWYILLFFLISIGFITYLGLNTASALHVILFPIIIIVMLLNCIFSFSRVELTNLFPIFGNGIGDIVSRIPEAMGASTEILILYFFLPMSSRDKFPKKVGFLALLIGGLATFFSLMTYVLTVVYPASTQYFLSMYQISRLSLVGKILNRAEDLFEIFWMTSVILALSIKLWLIVHILKKIFKIDNEKPLIWPVCIFGFALSFLPVSLRDTITAYEVYYTENLRWMIAFLPMIVLLAVKIKKKIGGRKHARNL